MPKNKPSIVTVLGMNYIAVRGQGSRESGWRRMQTVNSGKQYGIAYTTKMVKGRVIIRSTGILICSPPLEGFAGRAWTKLTMPIRRISASSPLSVSRTLWPRDDFKGDPKQSIKKTRQTSPRWNSLLRWRFMCSVHAYRFLWRWAGDRHWCMSSWSDKAMLWHQQSAVASWNLSKWCQKDLPENLKTVIRHPIRKVWKMASHKEYLKYF